MPFTDIEVETIPRFFNQAYVLIKADATKAAIDNQRLRTANCVHFSCHGYFNFESPLESALLLADEQPLTFGEILALDLSQCRLVTLSASESGLTDFTSFSDEYIGLPAAFLYAGSPSVVSSLWEPSDLSTAFLMIKFYENLLNQIKVAVALNQAQLWLRDVTRQDFIVWLNNLALEVKTKTHQMTIEDLLSLYAPNEKPFGQPFHWAAFCAIGQ